MKMYIMPYLFNFILFLFVLFTSSQRRTETKLVQASIASIISECKSVVKEYS